MILRACWPGSLAEPLSSRFRERSCLKIQGRGPGTVAGLKGVPLIPRLRRQRQDQSGLHGTPCVKK